MKKILFLATIILSLNATAQYSSIGLGVNGGLPTGGLKDNYSFGVGFDIDYLYEISDQISIGGASGLIYYSAKDVNGVSLEDRMYIPLAGSVLFNNDNDSFFIGGDFGYAIGISPSEDSGGIYFRPKLGYNINKKFNLNLFYSVIKKEQTDFSYIGLGLMMRL